VGRKMADTRASRGAANSTKGCTSMGLARTARRRRIGYAAIVAASAGAVALSGLAPAVSTASSHREAPYTSTDPQIDNTDTYAFTSPDKPNTVTLIANWLPFEYPAGGPNFYQFSPDAQYNINIDNDGDGREDVTYSWRFKTMRRDNGTFLYNTGPVRNLNDSTLNIYQTYDLVRIDTANNGFKKVRTVARDVRVAPSNVGAASMPDYARLRTQAVTSGRYGADRTTFAGQADDPFFLDLRVFDLLYGANLKEVGKDSLSGFNVQSVALQVPKSDVALAGNPSRNPVIGVWSTTNRRSLKLDARRSSPSAFGPQVQVSRLGMPLVNEVVVPLAAKDAFNASKPKDDAQFLAGVTNPEVPKLIEAIYGIKAPATPRNDLVQVFLTGVPKANDPALNADADPRRIQPAEEIRLNMAVPPSSNPNRLGFIAGDKAGFPNGRRLGDDVVDIELQVLEGELTGNPNDLGDGVNANDVSFSKSFPYVGLPNSGSVQAAGARPVNR